MTHYTCTRCNQPVARADLRGGVVSHLVDASLTFELCFNCYTCLRSFLRGDGVAAGRPDPAPEAGSAEKL